MRYPLISLNLADHAMLRKVMLLLTITLAFGAVGSAHSAEKRIAYLVSDVRIPFWRS